MLWACTVHLPVRCHLGDDDPQERAVAPVAEEYEEAGRGDREPPGDAGGGGVFGVGRGDVGLQSCRRGAAVGEGGSKDVLVGGGQRVLSSSQAPPQQQEGGARGGRASGREEAPARGEDDGDGQAGQDRRQGEQGPAEAYGRRSGNAWEKKGANSKDRRGQRSILCTT